MLITGLNDQGLYQLIQVAKFLGDKEHKFGKIWDKIWSTFLQNIWTHQKYLNLLKTLILSEKDLNPSNILYSKM